MKKENAYYLYFNADKDGCRTLNIPIKQILDSGMDMGEDIYLAHVTSNHIFLTQNKNEEGIFSKISGWFRKDFIKQYRIGCERCFGKDKVGAMLVVNPEDASIDIIGVGTLL